MKKSILLTILLTVFAFVSCSKLDFDFYFSQVGGPLQCQMDIDGETLQISSGNDVSKAPWDLGDGQYYAELEGITVFYFSDEHYIYIVVEENTTGRDRWFTVSGTKNGNEFSYKFRQKK